MPSHERTPSAVAVEKPAERWASWLREDTLEVEGRVPWSSNATFLLQVGSPERATKAIYKPAQGEQPLHDFPPGLYRREVAAYELARDLGWPNVPETIIRADAPFGLGCLQRFVPADFEQHYFTLLERPELHGALLAIAVFDLIVNNADRKAGHCLVDPGGEVWAIDHGLTFHVDLKLRTVVWEFGGEAVPTALLDDVNRVRAGLPESLSTLLAEDEIAALESRIDDLLVDPVLPELVSQRQYPWPLI